MKFAEKEPVFFTIGLSIKTIQNKKILNFFLEFLGGFSTMVLVLKNFFSGLVPVRKAKIRIFKFFLFKSSLLISLTKLHGNGSEPK